MTTLPFLLPVLLAQAGPAAAEGVHVEARTASVYAGACHYGGESVTAGREALVGLAFDGGSAAGVPLAGARVAVLLEGDANLEQESQALRATVWVDAPLGAEQRAAALCALRSHLRATDLELLALHEADIRFQVEGERVQLGVPGVAELSGALLPDRACCKMPQQVWYRPLGAVQQPLVVLCDEFSVHSGTTRFARHDENNGFVGRIDGGPLAR